MAIRIVRLGTPRLEGEGLRLGTVRRLPRGVKKSDYASRDLFDAWLPELAPSAELVAWIQQDVEDEARWKQFTKKYRREMQAPERQRLVEVLAKLSRQTDFSMGCYCERPERCHRAVLGEIFREHGAEVLDDGHAAARP